MDMPAFDNFNPIKFLYDLFFLMMNMVERVYEFLSYEFDIPKKVDAGVWDYELPLMDELPDSISIIQILDGTGVQIILILVFLKIVIPVF